MDFTHKKTRSDQLGNKVYLGDNIKMVLGQTGCKGADWIEPA